jgi:hypothetical protein
VESDHKAMIVISHPWEFVPKGSSHLNYHTNSSTSTSNTTTNITTTTTSNINNKTDNQQQKNTTTTTTANTLTGGCIVMQESNDKKIGPKKNVRVMINSEFNNTSLNDMSYAYWQKSPVIINKLNFEQQVIIIIFHIFNIN